ncbi:putative ribonuclease H-like domain-containing protein, partial [Tanacetum coccineum]
MRDTNYERDSTVSPSVSAAGQSFVNNDDLPTDPLMPDLKDTTDLPTGIFSGAYDDEDVGAEADLNNLDSTMNVSPIPITRTHKDHPKNQIIRDINSATQTRRMTKISKEHALVNYINKQRRTNHKDYQNYLFACFLSQIEPKKKVWTLVDLPNGKRAIGTKWVFRNKKDDRGIVVRNKARLVAQSYTQEEGIDYDKVFAPVARIEAIRLFLAYASFMRFIVFQMDVKSAFLYSTIEEEVYVCQPLGFEDPQFPDKVYKVEKALYGLHQAPRAWYKTLSTYLIENGFRRGTIDKTLFIKKDKGDILLVHVYVDYIIFGSTKKSLCDEFKGLIHKRFQMSSMGELTFFLGLQVQQKEDGIFISQDKYVVEILKKFDFATVKTASTPMEPNKALVKDEVADTSRPNIMFAVCACARFQVTPKMLHLYAVKRIFRYLKGQPKLGLWYPRDSAFELEAFSDSDYAGASLDRKAKTGGCQFLGKRLISWQCKKQTIVANSTIKAEYVAAANCYGQVLWIQNQMLDYGFNFMNTNIFIDNESTICIVKNPVFHSKTNHIEIRHHFIRYCYEKKLIKVIKIHTDHNLADLLTKAFDVSRGEHLASSDSGLPLYMFDQLCSHLKQIHVIVDGKAVVISESSVRSDILFNDEDGGDSVERAITTAASLVAAQDSDNVLKTQSTAMSNDPLSQEISSEGHTSGSGEGSMEHTFELMDNVPPTPYDSPLSGEEAKTAQDRIRLFKGRVKTSTDKSLGENASKQGRNDDKIDELNLTDGADTEVIMEDKGSGEKGGSTTNQVSTTRPEVSAASVPVNTLVKLRSKKAKEKEKGVVLIDEEEPPRLNKSTTTLQPLLTIDPKDKELAQRLHEKELAKLDRAQKERQKQEEATSAALAEEFDEIQARIDDDHELAKQLAAERAEAIKNKPPTRTQVRNRMIIYLKHMGKYTHQQLKHKNFEEIQKLYEREKKWIDEFKPINNDSQQQAESTKKRPRAYSKEESSKKQKLEEDNDAEKEDLRDSMDVVPRDDVAIDVESLATKYPIVDW